MKVLGKLESPTTKRKVGGSNDPSTPEVDVELKEPKKKDRPKSERDGSLRYEREAFTEDGHLRAEG